MMEELKEKLSKFKKLNSCLLDLERRIREDKKTHAEILSEHRTAKEELWEYLTSIDVVQSGNYGFEGRLLGLLLEISE
jgi:hypothetical protein